MNHNYKIYMGIEISKSINLKISILKWLSFKKITKLLYKQFRYFSRSIL